MLGGGSVDGHINELEAEPAQEHPVFHRLGTGYRPRRPRSHSPRPSPKLERSSPTPSRRPTGPGHVRQADRWEADLRLPRPRGSRTTGCTPTGSRICAGRPTPRCCATSSAAARPTSECGSARSACPARRVARRTSAFTTRGLGTLRLRARFETTLRRAGQPQGRTRAWTYCVDGAKGAAGVTAVFTPGGSVGLVASTARGHRIGNVVPGTRSGSLRGRARRISPTLWVGGRGSTRFVYRVVKGRVQTVGVTTRSIAKSRARLTAYLKLVQRRVPAPPPLVLADKAPTAVGARAQIPALEGRRDVDPQQLVLLCSLIAR